MDADTSNKANRHMHDTTKLHAIRQKGQNRSRGAVIQVTRDATTARDLNHGGWPSTSNERSCVDEGPIVDTAAHNHGLKKQTRKIGLLNKGLSAQATWLQVQTAVAHNCSCAPHTSFIAAAMGRASMPPPSGLLSTETQTQLASNLEPHVQAEQLHAIVDISC